jgi:transposase
MRVVLINKKILLTNEGEKMSTISFCYHTLGTINYQYLSTKYKDNAIYIYLEKKPDRQYCSECNSYDVTQKGTIYREIKTIPIGGKPIILCLNLHRLECHSCGAIRQEAIEVADPKKPYSKKLAAWVLDLRKKMTISDVANTTRLSWDQVKDIDNI